MSTPLSPEAARTWQLLAERVAGEPNPRVKANLEMVARHVEAEVRGDIPDLMSTLTAEPTYSFVGATDGLGRRATYRSRGTTNRSSPPARTVSSSR